MILLKQSIDVSHTFKDNVGHLVMTEVVIDYEKYGLVNIYHLT